jgi:hypothetical protein
MKVRWVAVAGSAAIVRSARERGKMVARELDRDPRDGPAEY